ncbi:MAG: glycosyltransferase N-terminal domain-containing protein [bacterium]|nr:glycosyltransferase N-terminal domain-containing protein [bacterium]
MFHGKVRDGLKGRRGLAERARAFRQRIGDRKVLLFHCASAGELEALKPIATEFDRNRVAIAVSYFSPSAQAALRRAHEFDFADFSPIDSVRNVREYLQALRPSLVAITKHDIWPNFAWETAHFDIPLFLINGNFHAASSRQWPLVRQFHSAVYSSFREVMTVSDEDSRRARRLVLGGDRVRTAGDARYDRVLARANSCRPLPDGVAERCRDRWVLVAGSTHPDDEELLLPLVSKLTESDSRFLLLLVPHDPSPRAHRRVEAQCRRCGLRFDDLDRSRNVSDVQVLLVNRTGILADLYQVGRAAYVGGGFGRGVHSVLEPMACGSPVLCGPNIGVAHEAGEARPAGIVQVMTGRRQCASWIIGFMQDEEQLDALRQRAKQFVQSRSGVAKAIAGRLKECLGE